MSDRLEQELKAALEARVTDPSEASQETPAAVESATPVLSEVEQKAYEMGWRPKGDYVGEHFVEAVEYVNRAPLFERIEKQSKELKELREMSKATAAHLSSVRKESYEQALRDLEARKLQSVQTGDVESYKKTELQTQEIQKKMQADPAIQVAQVDQAQQDAIAGFQERNKGWFNKDNSENQEMMEAAQFIDQKLAQAAHEKGIRLSPAEHLKAVEDKVKKLYAYKFENVNTEKPATVSVSSANKLGAVNNLVSRMTPQQREFGEYFRKHNPSYTLEKYAADLDRQGNLGK